MEKKRDVMLDNFNYYLANQGELVGKYNGKILLIVNKEVVGVYDSEADAYFDAVTKYPLGTFLIQLCTEGTSAYTQTLYSPNVVFAGHLPVGRGYSFAGQRCIRLS